jgi:DNA-binding CsgD family transcriptional regulator
VDDVDPAHQELFGWVVREAITNIVRHSRAGCCCVRLSRSSIEITDDGAGGTAPAGNGLTGLRERVAAAGGSIDAGPLHPAGWRLRVSLSPAIRRVVAGGRVIDPALAAATLAGGTSPLTARERDVLAAARPGTTVAEIARKLVLSEGTVRNYLSAAMAKVGARNKADAARVADERGWL